MGKQIKVTPKELESVASKISGVSILYNTINKDTKTTIKGNAKASKTIDEIKNITTQVEEIQKKFASDLKKYASGMKETDEAIARSSEK